MAGEIINRGLDLDLAKSGAAGQENNGFSASSLLGIDEKLPMNSVYRENRGGAVDLDGNKAQPVEGTDSIFNPFYVFRYAKFGSTDGKLYDANLHRNIRPISTGGASGSSFSFFLDKKDRIENPSASTIIEWAKDSSSSQSKDSTLLGPTPYQWSDFLWCKWYGKIPNNRLLTLRRYPIPVEDNLQIDKAKMPLIPLAQAVTWWGEGTNNSLSSILGIQYGFKWQPISYGGVDDVNGNEVEASDVLDALGFQGVGDTTRQVLLAAIFDNPANPFDSTGYDSELQNWIKNSYGSQGAYWNRVLGPVNVIENTQNRQRGFDFTHNISLNFTYKLRGYSRINPKVAFLDLISNFLSLTHNNAEFYGGAIRYFQKTGYIVPGLNTNKFELGDFTGGIQDVLLDLVQKVNTRATELNNFISQLTETGLSRQDALGALTQVGQSQMAQSIAGSWVKKLIQKPLQMRAFLDGRAVGEWHLTVGNPMDPIAVIGNLCLKDTTISFSESLGVDDFPTEVTFKVNLVHGRDRAKQDILSMFNLGAGSMTFTDASPPSSAFNSQGDRNSTFMNSLYNKTAIPDMTDETNKSYSPQNITGLVTGNLQTVINDAARTGVGQFSVGQNISLAESKALAEKYAGRVRKAYGEGFANSQVLTDYFRDLKTKD